MLSEGISPVRDCDFPVSRWLIWIWSSSNLASIWIWSGLDLNLIWNRSESDLGSIWIWSGLDLNLIWNRASLDLAFKPVLHCCGAVGEIQAKSVPQLFCFFFWRSCLMKYETLWNSSGSIFLFKATQMSALMPSELPYVFINAYFSLCQLSVTLFAIKLKPLHGPALTLCIMCMPIHRLINLMFVVHGILHKEVLRLHRPRENLCTQNAFTGPDYHSARKKKKTVA